MARRGTIVIQEALGQLRPDDDAPVQLDSVFPLSSITKTVTAALLMCLVEDGLVSISRPVRAYLPEISGRWTDDLQVHHLLTHTSGYSDEMNTSHMNRGLERGAEFSEPDDTQHPMLHEILELTWDAPLARPPGQEMGYCNHNYRLVGEIVRRVSGHTLDDFARTRLFDPLDMIDTHFVTPKDRWARHVVRPADAPGTQLSHFPPMIRPPERYFVAIGSEEYSEIPNPYGGATGTVRDLARYLQMYLNGGTLEGRRVLSRVTVEEMTRNHIPGIGTRFVNDWHDEASWGLGWAIGSDEKWPYSATDLLGKGSIRHSGAGGTIIWAFPREGLLGVLFSTALKVTPNGTPDWSADLFQNAVIGSIID